MKPALLLLALLLTACGGGEPDPEPPCVEREHAQHDKKPPEPVCKGDAR